MSTPVIRVYPISGRVLMCLPLTTSVLNLGPSERPRRTCRKWLRFVVAKLRYLRHQSKTPNEKRGTERTSRTQCKGETTETFHWETKPLVNFKNGILYHIKFCTHLYHTRLLVTKLTLVKLSCFTNNSLMIYGSRHNTWPLCYLCDRNGVSWFGGNDSPNTIKGVHTITPFFSPGTTKDRYDSMIPPWIFNFES